MSPRSSGWSLSSSGDGHRTIREGPLLVRWGDGTVELVQVQMRSRYTSVGDMGRRYDVCSEVPHIVLPGRGAVSIEEADIEVEERP